MELTVSDQGIVKKANLEKYILTEQEVVQGILALVPEDFEVSELHKKFYEIAEDYGLNPAVMDSALMFYKSQFDLPVYNGNLRVPEIKRVEIRDDISSLKQKQLQEICSNYF